MDKFFKKMVEAEPITNLFSRTKTLVLLDENDAKLAIKVFSSCQILLDLLTCSDIANSEWNHITLIITNTYLNTMLFRYIAVFN